MLTDMTQVSEALGSCPHASHPAGGRSGARPVLCSERAESLDPARAGSGGDIRSLRDLESASALEVLHWVQECLRGNALVTTSFGAESALTLHLVTQVLPQIPVVFIDTGYLFSETYRFAEQLTRRLKLNLRVYSPRISSARQEALFGKRWEGDKQQLESYQRDNKIEPMERAISELAPDAWIAGVRRDQTEFRSTLRKVELQKGLYKVHPVLDFSEQDIAEYFVRHDLPYHPLVARGYRSIGDEHSTFPVLPGEHARAGRLLGANRECGLHVATS